ncbi:MAG: hypothetical protein ACFFC7_03530 [Candidatus Hermodarchaeota archaeon]
MARKLEGAEPTRKSSRSKLRALVSRRILKSIDVFPCMLVRGKQHKIGKLKKDELEFFDYPADLAEHDHSQCFHLKNVQKSLRELD